MSKVNEAFFVLRGRESLADASRPGYVGRAVLEGYGEWPDTLYAGITLVGPGFPSTWPVDAESRQRHAQELEDLAQMLTNARDLIAKGEVPRFSLPPKARGATPASKADRPVPFVGRAVIETWQSGEFELAVETTKEMDLEAQHRFAVDCIDKVLLTLATRVEHLKKGRPSIQFRAATVRRASREEH